MIYSLAKIVMFRTVFFGWKKYCNVYYLGRFFKIGTGTLLYFNHLSRLFYFFILHECIAFQCRL